MMLIKSLKKLSALKLYLNEININTIKKCLPQDVYEYYLNKQLDFKKCYHKCYYCKKYFIYIAHLYDNYCSPECYNYHGDRIFNYLMVSLCVFQIIFITIAR